MSIPRIFVHCSDSTWCTATDIYNWHTDPCDKGDGTVRWMRQTFKNRDQLPTFISTRKGRGWSDIGYQYVVANGYPTYSHIKNNVCVVPLIGQISVGRTLDSDQTLEAKEKGAHVYGWNKGTVGICMVGRKEFHILQFVSTIGLIHWLMWRYNISINNVLGHYEAPAPYQTNKTCPNFDMNILRELIASTDITTTNTEIQRRVSSSLLPLCK